VAAASSLCLAGADAEEERLEKRSATNRFKFTTRDSQSNSNCTLDPAGAMSAAKPPSDEQPLMHRGMGSSRSNFRGMNGAHLLLHAA
jgi:hypothetical protein